MADRLCTKCRKEPRRSLNQRLGKKCHAEAMADTRARQREELKTLRALVPRSTPQPVERQYRPEIGKKISQTKIRRNVERRREAHAHGA